MTRSVGVTGASGFIGKALAAQLAHDGRTPELFDRDRRPDRRSLSGLDCVVHAAGITDPKADADALKENNVDLALNTLAAAYGAGCRRFVLISSIGVHGGSRQEPVGPETSLEPINPYSRSKVSAETGAARFVAGTGMDLVIVRPPMVYGPGCNGSFSALRGLIRKGAALPIRSATALRSFCSIDNLVSGLIAAIDHPEPPRVLIPADPEDMTAVELASQIAGVLGVSPRLFHAPGWAVRAALTASGRGEQYRSLFAPLKVDRSHWSAWGWSPPVPTREAIERAIKC